MSKYPHDPIIRGSFFKINKEYDKLRKYKKKQFRQQIIDKLDTFQSNNQNENSATCWITECISFVALLISEVVKFISSFKKLSSLFLIFGLKKNLCKIFRTFIVPYVSIWEVLQFSIDYLSLIGCQNFK
jgi:hypothetical protein